MAPHDPGDVAVQLCDVGERPWRLAGVQPIVWELAVVEESGE
jgi:hypothetical protein